MKQTNLLAAVLVLLLAAFLRFHSLEAQSFWNDEGNSARLSERPIGLIIEGTASDVHPPLYYLLLHAWRAGAGDSEFGLRAFSALAGVLTVAATMALARAVSRSPSAVFLIAGLLAAISPPLVYYAQETRMYALLALLAVFSTWLLWQWIVSKNKVPVRPHWSWLIAYSGCIFAGLYTHYFFPAIILGQALLVLCYLLVPRLLVGTTTPIPDRRMSAAIYWIGAVLVAVLGYAVWVPIFLRQIGSRPGQAQTMLDYLGNSGVWLAIGTTLPRAEAIWPLLAGVLLVLLGLVAGRRRAVVPLVMAGVPIGGSFLVGATDPAFFKFLLTAVPFLCILAALAWRMSGWQRVASAALTAVFAVGCFLSLSNMYSDPLYARADYRGMASRIAAEAHPNAAVILDAPNQWEVFTYYHRDGAPVFPLPIGAPDPSEVEPQLADIAAAHDRIYALFWGDSQRDPEHVVERWLDAHSYKATEEWIGDVRFVTYAVPSDSSSDLIAAGYDFQAAGGKTITLEAYGFQPERVAPGDIVEVQLIWSADAPLDQPYKVFVHLVDEFGNIIAQRDSEPAGGSRPTTDWVPGESIVDNYGILVPEDTSPGTYHLLVGLYDAFEPSSRLPVSIDGIASDSVELGSIIVP